MTVLERIRSRAPHPITKREREEMKKLMEKKLRVVKKSGGLDAYVQKSVLNNVTATVVVTTDEDEE